MQRPNAPRRFRAGSVDRRVAAVAFSLVAVVMLGAAAFTRTPLPAVDVRDPVAARDLVALMRAGERQRWIASYDFTRRLVDGRVLRRRTQEGRADAWHVVISGSTMTIEHGDRSFDCNLVDDRSGCSASPSGRALPASEVLRVAVAVGAYDVIREAGATIAGQPARCFRVRATGHGGLPGLGVETDLCLAADGVPLRTRVVRAPGYTDEQVATRLTRGVTAADVQRLARTFEPKPAKPSGSLQP